MLSNCKTCVLAGRLERPLVGGVGSFHFAQDKLLIAPTLYNPQAAVNRTAACGRYLPVGSKRWLRIHIRIDRWQPLSLGVGEQAVISTNKREGRFTGQSQRPMGQPGCRQMDGIISA